MFVRALLGTKPRRCEGSWLGQREKPNCGADAVRPQWCHAACSRRALRTHPALGQRAQSLDVGRPWRGGVMLDGQPSLSRAGPEEGLSCEPSRRQQSWQLGWVRNECPQVGLVCTSQRLLQESGPRISTGWELGTC